MNKRSCLGKEMKVNWATTSGGSGGGHQPKLDSSKHFHIFVGDLAPDIDAQTLREAFAPFGEISDVKIMKDPQTLVHKGYGFVSFVNKVDAESAIAQMNGQWLGTRKIRTNWATRKVQPGGMDGGGGGDGQQQQQQHPMRSHGNKYANKLDYNEVWSRASDTNTTVYCGGINNISEDVVRSTFSLYGQITGIHAFPDRGYAFIRFVTKEAACNAICGVHGVEINGGVAKCSWGKENIDISGSTTQTGVSNMGGGMNAAQSLYGGANPNLNSSAAAVAALQNVNSLQAAGNNPWTSGAAANGGGGGQNNSSAWTNYQWAATAAGYPQSTMNYWQGAYPNYQNAMAMQGWGVMPTAGAATGASAATANAATAAQYAASLGQYQQNTNGKS